MLQSEIILHVNFQFQSKIVKWLLKESSKIDEVNRETKQIKCNKQISDWRFKQEGVRLIKPRTD